ncbi:MAG: carbonic anhydrase [bacterium]
MKQEIKSIVNFIFIAAILTILAAPILTAQVKESSESEILLTTLLDGNNRYITGQFSGKQYTEERAELLSSQHPYAIILCCSDSRVPPELIFDESLGKLFVIRVAGNVIDSVTLGSIEYAAEHLNTKLLVVLGHESCGAVKAAIAGGEATPNIERIIKRIEPAVEKAEHNHVEEAFRLDFIIEENVKNQIHACLDNSKVLNELFEKKELTIAGAIYSLETGLVKLLHI